MLRINYPLNKDYFHAEYIAIFRNHFASRSFQRFMNTDDFILAGMYLDEILTGNFETLLGMVDILLGLKEKHGYTNRIMPFFDYDHFQPLIAKFFMKHAAQLGLATCFYCNIEYVNIFEDLADFLNGLDLVNRGDEEDLQKIKHIDNLIARLIIQERQHAKITSIDTLPVTPRVKQSLKKMDAKANKNHFTLDHLLNKAKFPLFSLSLYNLVPCCYSCNSKFKKEKELFDKADHPPYMSPTSDNHAFNDHVKFKLLYKNNDITTVNQEQDFALHVDYLQHEAAYRKYMHLFKLGGRYSFHKREAMTLITKMKKYSNTRVEEIARITGIPAEKIKEDIFGSELFNGKLHEKPLTKLRRDIAREIGIDGVIE